MSPSGNGSRRRRIRHPSRSERRDDAPAAAPDRVSYREVFRGELGRLAVGLLLLEFVSAVQVFVTSTILPLVSRELNGGRFYGIALSAGTVALFVSTPASAPLSRRFGPRVVLAGAACLHVAGTVISLLAPSMLVFAAGRLVTGLGSGAMFAIGYATVAEQFPARLRPRMIALLTSMWLLPSLIGPSGAALVATLVGWRWALFGTVPPVLLAVVLVIGRIRRAPGPPERSSPTTWIGTAVMTCGAVAISVGGSSSGAVAVVLVCLGAVLALGGAVWVMPDGTLTGSTPTGAAVGGLLLGIFAFFGGDSLITLLVTEGLGRSIAWAAAALSVGGISWSVATLLQPRMLERLDNRGFPIVAAGAGLVAAGLALLLLVLGLGNGPYAPMLVMLAWTVGGAGMGLVYPTLSVSVLLAEGVQPSDAAAALVLAEALGGTLSIAIGGSLVSLSSTITGSFTTGLWLAYSLYTVTAAAVIYYGARAPARLVQP